MMKKLSTIVLLSALAATAAIGQKTPEKPAAPTSPKAVSPAVTFEFTPLSGGYLGVELKEVTSENFAGLGLSEVRGVAVGKVADNSPAAKAGLQQNDVIVKVDGESITSVRKLSRLISEIAPDHKSTLTVVRGGAEQEIVVTVGKREYPSAVAFNGFKSLEGMKEYPRVAMPEMPRMPAVTFEAPAQGLGAVTLGDGLYYFGDSRRLGVTVSSMSKQLAKFFGTDGEGLLVNEVREDSPAAKAGLRAGDVILEADGRKLDDRTDLVRALSGKKEGDINLVVVRDKQKINVTVR